MKKHLLACLVILVTIFGCNKKEKNEPEPVIGEIKVTELTDPDFIQFIEVPGSEKIIFDSTLNAYLVTLPASFETDRINITFKFYPGAYLTTGHSEESAERLDFIYRNRAPLSFQISSAKQKIEAYQVYVEHNGELKGSIYNLDNFQCDPDGNFTAVVEITSGLGTIPETPNSGLTMTAILKDDKT